MDTSKFREFGLKVSKYFLDFLETDFHRQQAPRRRIQLRNDANQATGVALRKYDALYRTVIGKLGKDVSSTGSRVIDIPRGRYKAGISPILKNLIGQFVDSIEPQKFAAVTAAVLDAATTSRSKAASDPEKYIADVQAVLQDTAAREIVHPLLALLDKPIRDHAYSAIESVFEIETELVSALTAESHRQMAEALNKLLIKGDDSALKAVLVEFFDESHSRQSLKDYFDSFATSDAWQEVRDLQGLTRIAENQQLYLYVADLRFGNSLYPVVYIPLTVTQDDQSGEFHLELDSHLYINKRAIDFVAQELALPTPHRTLYAVNDRIVYLEPGGAPAPEIDRTLSRVQALFDLDSALTIEDSAVAIAQSSRVRLSTAAYLNVFDRSDEALLNDYEALLSELGSEPASVGALFEKIIHGLLLDNPVDVSGEVREFWDGLEVPLRLVTESPIPLNEEQRKALAALENPNVNFVTVQGPPGTGKSHLITAIAFECILRGRTVLVLSDKTEALDVVEDKLTQAINKVRPNKGFQNPILRLGRTGGTYTKLLSHAAVETISDHYHAAGSRRREIEDGIRSSSEALTRNIKETIDHLSRMSLSDIEAFEKLEEKLSRRAPEVVEAVTRGEALDFKARLDDANVWKESDSGKFAMGQIGGSGATTIGNLLRFMRQATVGNRLGILAAHRQACAIFRGLRPSDGHVLQQFIARYDDLRMPLFGYLFRRRKLRQLDGEVAEKLSVENFLGLHKRLDELRILCEVLPKAAIVAREWGTSDEEFCELYERIVHRGDEFSDYSSMLRLMSALGKTLSERGVQIAAWKIGENERFAMPAEVIGFSIDTVKLMELWAILTGCEKKVPVFDYVADCEQLQQLCAAKMTFNMDSRFLRFCNESAATAKVLTNVIRKKEKFPTETFAQLRDAFPCIIASVRDFAEYIPLQKDLFDLVVIDEASQVSVAQALPALLRAKKVLVLGDDHQFSNVKSAYASNERNSAYVSDLQSYFKTNISERADLLERAARFDVKNSVLDFFSLIRNFSIMLRKHRRGYQELISFSSDYFYGKRLQAVKFRGKPIEEVIKFTELEHDGRPEKYRNTNSLEATFILDQLDKFLEMEKPPTVGVITPFREQVALLSKLVLEQPNARDYQEALKLKIMTFDSCQGEEREVILYSMVATRTNDALRYIFPADLENSASRIAEDLRLQRLNVGFSRAQECIHFILSKPVSEYSGSIRIALNHYRRLLDEKDKVDPGGTDPTSPMERKLLAWLQATHFYQENRDSIELRPQFPIGEYLHQLDPNYHHPNYRVDFLLTYQDDERLINLVIEYDGFKEHFTELAHVNSANWAFYCKPGDIERQITLESYGYKFLRINRFNLGADPVAALSERLETLVGKAKRGNGKKHKIVDGINKDAAALANGDKKFCRKCSKTKLLKDFFDGALKNGNGGYGRYCAACKAIPAGKKPLEMASI